MEWKDIDWDNHLISVKRTSAWTKEKGIYTDTPKTNSSLRIIKVPDVIIEKLTSEKCRMISKILLVPNG